MDITMALQKRSQHNLRTTIFSRLNLTAQDFDDTGKCYHGDLMNCNRCRKISHPTPLFSQNNSIVMPFGPIPCHLSMSIVLKGSVW